MFRDNRFDLEKSTKPQSKQFGVQDIYTKLCATLDDWITVSFPTFFPEMRMVNILQEKQKIASFLSVG